MCTLAHQLLLDTNPTHAPAGDICLNEVLLMRLSPDAGAPLSLFYSDAALYDAKHSIMCGRGWMDGALLLPLLPLYEFITSLFLAHACSRSIPHTLKSDFTECWALDGRKPILSSKHVARTILRYFKGHGTSYQFDQATWDFYRRNKLGPITLFQARAEDGDGAHPVTLRKIAPCPLSPPHLILTPSTEGADPAQRPR